MCTSLWVPRVPGRYRVLRQGLWRSVWKSTFLLKSNQSPLTIDFGVSQIHHSRITPLSDSYGVLESPSTPRTTKLLKVPRTDDTISTFSNLPKTNLLTCDLWRVPLDSVIRGLFLVHVLFGLERTTSFTKYPSTSITTCLSSSRSYFLWPLFHLSVTDLSTRVRRIHRRHREYSSSQFTTLIQYSFGMIP